MQHWLSDTLRTIPRSTLLPSSVGREIEKQRLHCFTHTRQGWFHTRCHPRVQSREKRRTQSLLPPRWPHFRVGDPDNSHHIMVRGIHQHLNAYWMPERIANSLHAWSHLNFIRTLWDRIIWHIHLADHKTESQVTQFKLFFQATSLPSGKHRITIQI